MTCDPDTPCHDEWGQPVWHCTARSRCRNHTNPGRYACYGCVATTRTRIEQLTELAALMHSAAIDAGRVDSAALNLAAHAADPEAWEHHTASAEVGRIDWLVEDPSGKTHPEYLFRWWAMTLRDAFDTPQPVTQEPLVRAAEYVAGKIAMHAIHEHLNAVPDTSIAALYRQLGAAIDHAQMVIRDNERREKGIPCPACTQEADSNPPRLVRYHGATEPDDTWRCRRNPGHTLTQADYTTALHERAQIRQHAN